MDRSTPVSETGCRRPGEPVSAPLNARNAPLTPATLKVETAGSGSVALPRPAVLSNVAAGRGCAEGDTRDPGSARVEEIHRVAAAAQAHAGAAVGADDEAAGGRRTAEPGRREGGDDRRIGRPSHALEEDGRLPRRGCSSRRGAATAVAKAFELSSIFQPVMSTAVVPVFVTSNQSAA